MADSVKIITLRSAGRTFTFAQAYHYRHGPEVMKHLKNLGWLSAEVEVRWWHKVQSQGVCQWHLDKHEDYHVGI